MEWERKKLQSTQQKFACLSTTFWEKREGNHCAGKESCAGRDLERQLCSPSNCRIRHVSVFQDMHAISACYKTQARANTSHRTWAQASLIFMPNPTLQLVQPWVFSLLLELVRNKAAWGIINTRTVQGKLDANSFRSDRHYYTTLLLYLTWEGCIVSWMWMHS